MKQVQLNKFKPNVHPDAPKFALVDDEDFDLVNKYNWQAIKGGHTFYAMCSATIAPKKRKVLQMHRIIMKVDETRTFIDHKDHNGVNNTKENLRICSYTENSCNKISQKSSTSKYLGVSWKADVRPRKKDTNFEPKGNWAATCGRRGSRQHIGLFKDEIEAAKAYDKKAKELFGEFANLNFPNDI